MRKVQPGNSHACRGTYELVQMELDDHKSVNPPEMYISFRVSTVPQDGPRVQTILVRTHSDLSCSTYTKMSTPNKMNDTASQNHDRER